MPRVARITVEGYPYHITQRGNNRSDVFFVDDDRRQYLKILKEQSERYGMTIEGYCLMTNHLHLIAVPWEKDSLAKAVGRANFLYTQYVNRLHGRSGHLWQNRFFSCLLDERHYWTAIKYVERNPVRAKIVRRAWRYEWSSAAAHIGENDSSGMLKLDSWDRAPGHDRWKITLVEPDDDKATALLMASTTTGRPLGSDSFISKLEIKLGKRLRPLPVGRPRKDQIIGDCP